MSAIARFWMQAEAYTGCNFFVLTYHGRSGKPHLKACRRDQ